MALFDRLLGRLRDVPATDMLYRRIVTAARVPDWYLAGAVPDSVDGRFDVIALVLALVLLRLEAEGEARAAFSAELTERFIDDMDGSLREIGVGDQAVGKHIGRMVSALGGRLGAYRDALAEGDVADTLAAALRRNLYREAAVEPAAVDWSVRRAQALWAALNATPVAALVAGELP